MVTEIKKRLSPDLLKGYWKDKGGHRLAGHCYVATEVLYLLIGRQQSKYRPYVLNHKICPQLLAEGETHWYLMNPNDMSDVVDITEEQFGEKKVPHAKGVPNGMMNHPERGSKRARIVIERMKTNEYPT